VSLALAVAAAMFAGVVVYAIFGGADFGSGFFDLTAGGARRGAQLRTLIDHSIGPVWEANHVWLIYILVTWWTGFPDTFAAAMNTLFVPMMLALVGIVLRGASFAFRKYSATLAQARLFGIIFAGSSLITPFFLGCVAGAVASGRVPADGQGDLMSSWLNPTSVLGGLIAVGTCAFLAGSFLVADAERAGHTGLAESLRTRTVLVGLVTGAVVFIALVPLSRDAPVLYEGLTGRALPVVVLSAAAGLGALVLVWRRNYARARFFAVTAVATVVVGWALGQYPWFLVNEVTISQAAGARTTLQALLVVVALAVVLVLPPLAYLFHLTQSEKWSSLLRARRAAQFQMGAPRAQAGHCPHGLSRTWMGDQPGGVHHGQIPTEGLVLCGGAEGPDEGGRQQPGQGSRTCSRGRWGHARVVLLRVRQRRRLCHR
jgi:cytochrome d ubiquinol oxidase subunit II